MRQNKIAQNHFKHKCSWVQMIVCSSAHRDAGVVQGFKLNTLYHTHTHTHTYIYMCVCVLFLNVLEWIYSKEIECFCLAQVIQGRIRVMHDHASSGKLKNENTNADMYRVQTSLR